MNRRMIMLPGLLLVALVLGIQPGLANISGPVTSAAAQSIDPALATANVTSLSIDTTPNWDGAKHISDFGAPNTATFGQTISMAKNGTLTQFSFFMNISTTAIFRGYVYAWDGAKASGEPLFASGAMHTQLGTAFEAVIFNIPGGITLNAGKQYVLFASTSNDTQLPSAGQWGSVNNVYTGGEFVYQNTGSPWVTTNDDLAFKATFAEALVTPAALTLSEPDESGIFTIRLSTQPAAAVTISLASSDPTECTVPASVDLTSTTWQAGVPVTVNAVDDTRADGSQVCTIHLTASSSDSRYNAIDINDVTVTVTDNEALVTPAALTLSEPDGSGIFTIRLPSQPAAAVTISLASSDPTECTVPASVDLTGANWQAGVPVTVSAVDDTRADGSQVCAIHLTASSSDSRYNATAINDVTVTVTDNEYGVFLPFVVNAAKE